MGKPVELCSAGCWNVEFCQEVKYDGNAERFNRSESATGKSI